MESLGNYLLARPYASLAVVGVVAGAQICCRHLPGLGWVILGSLGIGTARHLLRSVGTPLG